MNYSDFIKVNGLTKHTKSFLDICVKQDSSNVFYKTGDLLFLGGNEVLFPYSRTLQSISLLKKWNLTNTFPPTGPRAAKGTLVLLLTSGVSLPWFSLLDDNTLISLDAVWCLLHCPKSSELSMEWGPCLWGKMMRFRCVLWICWNYRPHLDNGKISGR